MHLRALIVLLLCTNCDSSLHKPVESILVTKHSRRSSPPTVISIHCSLRKQEFATIAKTTTPSPTNASADTSNERGNQTIMLAKQASRRDTLICLFAMMSGATGVLCYHTLGFCAHMITGFIYRLMRSVSDADWFAALSHALLVIGYALGASLFRVLELYHERKGTTEVLPMSTALAALPFFCLSDHSDAIGSVVNLVGPVMAIGFGIINAFSLNHLKSVTNAATGHLTRLSMGSVDAFILGTQTNYTSLRYLLSFVVSVMVSTILCRIFTVMGSPIPLPPMGFSIGMTYAVLLLWYSGCATGSL